MSNATKLSIKWDMGLLNKLIGMVFKKNINVTIANLRNIQKLVQNCNFSAYQNKNTIMKRVTFLKRALEARLDHKFEDESIIIDYCRVDLEDPITEDIINNLPAYKKTNYNEIKYMNQFVEDRLKFGVIQTHRDRMVAIIEKIDSGEYATYAQAFLLIKDWIADFQSESRRISSDYTNNMLSLNDPNINEAVKDIISKLGNTHSTLITGMQMFNEMLSPGFRPGKLYTILGLSGGFKSALLLKIVLDCVKYNAESYRPKKEGLKPVVLYVTMENTKEESFARMFNMECVSDDMENYSSEHIVECMEKTGVVHNDNMEIIIAYRPNRSINTADLRNMIDQLEEEGKEVVMLSFDYIKRIKPVEAAVGEKEELKNVTNELRQIAVDYFIPVVTAHQVNRAGVATVNTAMRDNKADLAKFIGQENVGSAWEVVENTDFLLILNIERRSDGRLFLTFKRLKTRYRPATKLDYFNQPFTEDNEFKLMDDILMDKPLGVVSLSTDLEGVDTDDLLSNRGRRQIPNDTTVRPSRSKVESIDEMAVAMSIFDLNPINSN